MVANNVETHTYDKWIDSQECKVIIESFQNQMEIKKKILDYICIIIFGLNNDIIRPFMNLFLFFF